MAKLIFLQDIVWDGTVSRGGQNMFLLQWMRGLERLGHEVVFLDFIGSGFEEGRAEMLRAFDQVISKWWHSRQTALVAAPTMEALYGMDLREISRFADAAAAILTVSAPFRREPPELIRHVRPRILFESDPAYTHLWAGKGHPADLFGEHDVYFTVGGNIGTPRCSVPTCGIQWRHLWHPIVLEWWPPAPLVNDRFTTVADWYHQGYVEFEGRMLGPKAEEFRKFIDLPALAGEEVEIVININPDDPDIDDFKRLGWRLENPDRVRTPEMYRDLVAGSAAEFSCAKGGYAGTRCGWFSDRSECFLAAGRPVVLQSTGFEDLLPTGKGLFAVKTVEEAAEAIRAIRTDYPAHSAAALALAREHFDSDKILSQMLAVAGV
jgi:hypothetical protein